MSPLHRMSTPLPIHDTPPSSTSRRGRRPAAAVDVLGVPLALTDYERTMDWIDATVAAGGRRATSASPPSTP